jgi:uncharacterized protein
MVVALKPMAITTLGREEIAFKLGVSFESSSDVLGERHIAVNNNNDNVQFQIRIYEHSPKPSTEILLSPESAREDLDKLLSRLKLSRNELFWIHPRAGGTLRRRIVDSLHSNLDSENPLIQIVLGPRQVGKTTAVEHLVKEWKAGTHYCSADSVVTGHSSWLEEQWSTALQKGSNTLLAIDEIQKVPNWSEIVKFLWDKTKGRNLKVVILGSTGLSSLLANSKSESLAGRFDVTYVPQWSFAESREVFGIGPSEYALFGGYPKALELVGNLSKWQEYIGKSIIGPIIDVDIFQQGNFRDIQNLRKAFQVFCESVNEKINYRDCLRKIQSGGNVEIVKRYMQGYIDAFLMSPVYSVNDKGKQDTRKNPSLMLNCPAIYTFGRGSILDFQKDPIRFQQLVTSELFRVPNQSFGHWQNGSGEGIDLYIRTSDNQEFGVVIEGSKNVQEQSKGREAFRKKFKKARLATITQGNISSFISGQRAFLENSAI